MMASPLYRQEQEWKQNGIPISRQTMSNWLIKACEDWLEPIYEEMKKRLCEHEVLHADGYKGYYKLPENITVVGCWAYVRRKFFDAKEALPKDKQPTSNAAKEIAYCDKLFHLEKQFALLCPENRLKEREKQSKPLIDEFYDWIGKLNVLPKTHLGKAVQYAQSQRKYLGRYITDGRLEISNNRAERSIKPFVIGRKNWLFSNTPSGARASAVYYSLAETAKENGLNPFEYLSWIFTQAPNLGKLSFADLLPGSTKIPPNVFIPKSKRTEPEKYAWEEDE